ncbi:hypothetical protein [Rivibacter subsaxonicus]|uniref:Uncharacterized protein n=1 Tax=Rivibacter subsaxonicus TaxID=457575 RepID=A0A4Q7W155_9BURK|nr:hypothetical protein [Rivibacter subsaxonicus]RZU02941.1 hypothetical protein EV670_0972 [Rivibacter subsaxonicus]
MITQTLAALTSLSTRIAVAVAAVSLSALQLAGLADIASPDTRTVMLERVVIEGHRDLQQPVNVAQNLTDRCATPNC